MNSSICEAIKTKKVISFFYDGGVRIVEPFCYGCNTKNNDVLCAYQIGGYSSSGNPDGWKLYIVSNMSDFTITNKSFLGRRDGYNPADKRMINIYCNI